MSSSDWDWYTSEAASLASSYPIDDDKIESGDYSTWANESLTIAQQVVYPNFVNHEVPSDSYKDAAKPIIEERLMFGGARLAALIEDIYGSSSEESVTEAFNQMVFDSFLQ